LKVIESKQFKDELRAIAFYIKKDKPTASIAFVSNLKKLLKGLVDFPYKYRQSIYFENKDIRDLTYVGYTIVYVVNEDYIEILSIFNRNLPDL